MNQHDENALEIPLTELAATWRRYAELDGIADMTTELMGLPAGKRRRDGYWPGFFLPATGRLVIVKSAQAHPTPAAARSFMVWMLQRLHDNGSITLYPSDQEAEAPAQEATS